MVRARTRQHENSGTVQRRAELVVQDLIEIFWVWSMSKRESNRLFCSSRMMSGWWSGSACWKVRTMARHSTSESHSELPGSV